MKILITAGRTNVPIDQVRFITNFATGSTGAFIAQSAVMLGHQVVLLTSNPQAVRLMLQGVQGDYRIESYDTFAELHTLLEQCVREQPDALIHSAAISDYQVSGAYSLPTGVRFEESKHQFVGEGPLMDRRADKIKSDEPELWLRLTRAPKLVDLVRSDWEFKGILVKFKLEVAVSDSDLLQIAEASRLHSQANLMVANTLESASGSAYVGPGPDGSYKKVPRLLLGKTLMEELQRLKKVNGHG